MQRVMITLSDDVAEWARRKVDAGRYANETEAIEDGLRTLAEDDAAVENWLRTEAAAAYDDMIANPAEEFSVEDVKRHLAERRSTAAGH